MEKFEEIMAKSKREGLLLGMLQQFCLKIADMHSELALMLIGMGKSLETDQSYASCVKILLKNLQSEFEDLSQDIRSISETFIKEASKPLETFQGVYQMYCNSASAQGTNVLFEAMRCRKETEDQLNASSEESGLVSSMGEFEALEAARAAHNKEVVLEANKALNRQRKRFAILFESMQSMERHRVDICKNTIGKVSSHFEKLGKLLIDKSISINSVVGFTRPEVEIDLMFENTTELDRVFLPIEHYCLPPDYIEHRLQKIEDKHKLACLFQEKLEKILKAKMLSLDEKADIAEQFHSEIGRETFLSCAESLFPIGFKFVAYESFKVFAEILECLLTAALAHEEIDPYSLQTVLKLSRGIHVEISDGPCWLFELLHGHGIWKHTEIWKLLIANEIEKKIEDSLLKHPQISKGWVQYFKEKVKPPSKVEDQSLKMRKACATTVNRQYAAYMNSMGVGFEEILQILKHFQINYGLDPGLLQELMMEVYSERRKDTLKRHYGGLRKCRICETNSPLVVAILGSQKYLPDAQSLLNILLLNKKIYSYIYPRVIKQALVRFGAYNKDILRIFYYAQQLGVKDLSTKYKQLIYEISQKEIKIADKIDKVIVLDVKRSFYPEEELSSESIISVLRAYSIYNSEVEYCQGMNYV